MSDERFEPDDETGTNNTSIPPTTFHQGRGGFRPTFDYQPIPELRETVDDLQAQGRLRSALNVVLQAIDAHPNHPEPLVLAMLVAGVGRSERLQAVEPLSDAMLLDPRLDPIFTVCSQCESSWWVSTNCLLRQYAKMAVTSPIGLQCYNCGFVVCRECLRGQTERSGEAGFISTQCPNCHASALGTPVYPTGRIPQQLARASAPIVAVLVFREGPIAPDAEYLQELLQFVSPDIFDEASRPLIKAFPAPNRIESLSGLAMAFIARMEGDGSLPRESLSNASIVEGRDRYGARICIAKITQALPSNATGTESTVGKSRQSDAVMYEIGILFDIDELGGGIYGRRAYEILFRRLDPMQLTICHIFDGDTEATLDGDANIYCIAFQATEQEKIHYIVDTLASHMDVGLLPAANRYLTGDVVRREPLVWSATIAFDGSLRLTEDTIIRPSWVEGTKWTIQ
jgi:hypothetical protein